MNNVNKKLEDYDHEFLNILAKGFQMLAEKRDKENLKRVDEKEHPLETPHNQIDAKKMKPGIKYLRIKDICESLGCSNQYVSELLKRPVDQGGIPCIRLSRRMILIDPADFDEWGKRMKTKNL